MIKFQAISSLVFARDRDRPIRHNAEVTNRVGQTRLKTMIENDPNCFKGTRYLTQADGGGSRESLNSGQLFSLCCILSIVILIISSPLTDDAIPCIHSTSSICFGFSFMQGITNKHIPNRGWNSTKNLLRHRTSSILGTSKEDSNVASDGHFKRHLALKSRTLS